MEGGIHNNEQLSRYELTVEGHVAVIEYSNEGELISLNKTEVPKQLEGKGVASKLVVGVFKDIEDQELKLQVRCPFVTIYLKRHPEWSHLMG